MPQVDIRLDFLSFREHSGAYNIFVEDEHPPISVPLRNNLDFFLDEAPEMRELDLHPLVNDLSDLLRGTSPTFSIECGVSSPVATTLGCSGFSKYENHSLWLIIWFDAPESTYHTSSNFGVVFFIEFASCLVMKAAPFLPFLDPST